MHILVTGLNGFTGRYVEKAIIAAGHKVSGLSANLLDAQSVYEEISELKPEAVIHLAGVANVAHNDVNEIYKVHLIGTRNLLKALRANVPNVKKVLLASSAYVYGNTQELITEGTKPKPDNDYAVSKLSMEYMAKLWDSQLPIVITRPFNYTGVGQSNNFLIPKIVAHFRKQAESIELGNIDVWRDFGDVRFVADAYVRLLEGGTAGEVYNICSGNLYALRDVIEICSNLTGHKIEIQVNPHFIRGNELKSLSGDASKLKQILTGWEMPHLSETLEWMLKE